jgi:hypothetical protein
MVGRGEGSRGFVYGGKVEERGQVIGERIFVKTG